MSTDSIIVLDRLDALPRRLDPGPVSGSTVVLSLTPREDHLRQLVEHVHRRVGQLRIVRGASQLDEIALDLRPEYARLVASAADRIEVGTQRLREAFSFDERISLWWLNEIFGKRSDLYPGFTRLCQAELIRSLTHRERPHGLLLITKDAAFWRVIRAFCRQQGLTFRGRRPWSATAWTRKWAMPRVILSSVLWFLRTIVQTVVARTVSGHPTLGEPNGRQLCVFHTIYPLLWKSGSSDRDEKYDTVPRLLERGGRLRPVYACSFSSDGRHQHVTVRQFMRLCGWLRTKEGRVGGIPIVLIDGFARLRDVFAATGQLRLIVRYYLLERSRSYRDHWVLRGIRFSPLLRDELRAAMVRTPRYLLHALRIRRFVEQVQPRALVYYHFDFGLGRAIAFGSLTGSPQTALIGAQEGPVARLKLWSTNAPGELRFGKDDRLDLLSAPPVPDLVLLEGPAARERLLEAGYPQSRLRVLGAPRVSRLCELRRQMSHAAGKTARSAAADRLRVLVALGSNDDHSLLEALHPALGLGPRFHFLIKPHPRGGLSGGEAERRLAALAPQSEARSSFSVETEDVYQLLATADLVLATYSSLAMEAAALGYPLLCLALPDRITASPLRDRASRQIQFAATADELVNALRRHLASPSEDEKPLQSEIGEYFFGHLDGSSQRRWAEAIEEYLVDSGEAGTSPG